MLQKPNMNILLTHDLVFSVIYIYIYINHQRYYFSSHTYSFFMSHDKPILTTSCITLIFVYTGFTNTFIHSSLMFSLYPLSDLHSSLINWELK